MAATIDVRSDELFGPDIPLLYESVPRQVRLNAFTFEELIERGGKAADKAREWLRDGATDHDWWDCLFDEWKQALSQIGFDNADISFSGFWSQGDGASFTADVDLMLLIPFIANPPQMDNAVKAGADGKEDWRPWIVHQVEGVQSDAEFVKLLEDEVINECSMKIKRTDHRYSHEHTCAVDYEDNLADGPIRDLWLKFKDHVKQLRVELCRAIYDQLEKEYDYRTSDEALKEDAEANDWLFDSSGRHI